MSNETSSRRELRLPVPPEEVVDAVRDAADAWDAQLEGWAAATNGGVKRGQLRLSLAAGLRHGMVHGEIEVAPEGHGSRVAFEPHREEWWLNTTAVSLLALAGAGALLTVLWPFFPGSALAQVAPLGMVLALGGWFLVVSRVTTRDVGAFLALVEHLALPPDVTSDPPRSEPPEPTRPA